MPSARPTKSNISYIQCVIRVHIKPALGATSISNLDTQLIQDFYNKCSNEKKLSAKTVKNIHCVMHKSLQQAVANGYIKYNPSEACTLPRVEKQELKPFDEVEIAAFLREIRGSRMETFLTVALFTGMREGELMGLMWKCVDFASGTITVNKQLQLGRGKGVKGEYRLISAKNGKSRVIVPADFVMQQLRRHRDMQAEEKRIAGNAWEENDFVFTDEFGHHLMLLPFDRHPQMRVW